MNAASSLVADTVGIEKLDQLLANVGRNLAKVSSFIVHWQHVLEVHFT